MNPIDDNAAREIDEQVLDRLVDGELSEAERRGVLLGLDREPEGWRRCALAFLESQCWKKELGELTGPAIEPAVNPQPARRRSVWPQRLATLVAMAASLVVALVLGMQLRHGSGSAGLGQADRFASAGGEKSPSQRQPGTVPVVPDAPSGDDWQLVEFVAPDGPDGRREMVRLPAIRRDQLDENWPRSLPAAVPSDVLSALERMGHEVRQRRELMPVELKDGRRLVVPVDRVEVHYVGRPSL